jgi:vanillate monooxygenase ferredoxin subunit
MSSPTHRVTIVDKEPLADDAFGFWLENVADAPLPPFSAGAHVDVHLGPGMVRQYSLANAPTHPAPAERYRIGVLRERDGRGGSATLCDRFAPGDELSIGAPRNRFPLVEDAPHSVLLAGGIGVTPLLSMAWRLHALGRSFRLHYAVRAEARAAFLTELRGAPFANAFSLHVDTPSGPSVDLAAALEDPDAGAHLYTCGPAGFMDAVFEAARGAGWTEGQLHREDFQVVPREEDRAIEVVLAKRGITVRVPPDLTIAEALEDEGVFVPMSCEAGMCGTCVTPVLEGVPDHRDQVLSPEERAAGDKMTVCCSRAHSDRLVLDL